MGYILRIRSAAETNDGAEQGSVRSSRCLTRIITVWIWMKAFSFSDTPGHALLHVLLVSNLLRFAALDWNLFVI